MTKLDICWKNCLRMWKWISENWKKGMPIGPMKRQWLREHGFTKSIDSNCFFCQYAADNDDKEGESGCRYCPGKLVNQRFSCINKSYDYFMNPKKFYAKLVQYALRRCEGLERALTAN